MFDHFDPPPRRPAERLATFLDVTLRDGGFEVDFDWPERTIRTMPRMLAPLGIGVVELGYIGGVPLEHAVAAPGRSAFLTADLVASATHAGVVVAAMVHPTALDGHIDLSCYAKAGLGMVRLVYHPTWARQIADLAREAKDCGLTVTVNIALASRYARSALLRHAATIAAAAPIDILYVADTCGALLPTEVDLLVRELKRTVAVEIGFHAHDFLSLAYANSLAAASAGAAYLDCSVLGLGRGGGNLQTELMLICHRLAGRTADAPLRELLEQRAVLAQLADRPLPSLWATVCGALNLTPVEESALLARAEQGGAARDESALLFLASGESAATLKGGRP
jgi:4-hydroxy 2-oxovalerate aldolase